MPTIGNIRKGIENETLKGFSGLNRPSPFAGDEEVNEELCGHDLDAFALRGSYRTSDRPDANRVYNYVCTVPDCNCRFQTWEEWR